MSYLVQQELLFFWENVHLFSENVLKRLEKVSLEKVGLENAHLAKVYLGQIHAYSKPFDRPFLGCFSGRMIF